MRTIILATVLCLAACQTPSSPKQALADLDIAYRASVAAMTLYGTLPSADPTVLADMAKASLAARDALNVAHAYVDQGNLAALDAAVQAVRDALVIMDAKTPRQN